MIKRNKSGRYYDDKTGFIVSSKKAKKLLNKSHHHNYPKHRRSIAVKKLTIREYKDGSFSFDPHNMDDRDLLYYSHWIEKTVDGVIYNSSKKLIDKDSFYFKQ